MFLKCACDILKMASQSIINKQNIVTLTLKIDGEYCENNGKFRRKQTCTVSYDMR